MDETIIAFVAILVGAVCATIVPFLLKRLNNPEAGVFDLSYVYALVLTLIVAAFAILPAPELIDVSFRGIFTLFLAGLGLEGAINKANTIRIKGKLQPTE